MYQIFTRSAFCVASLRTNWNTAFPAASNALDLVAIDYENCILGDFAVCGINHSAADERNFLSERATRQNQFKQKKSDSIHKPRVSPADSVRTIRSASRSSDL